jgi:hypothetical protein
LDLSWVPPTSTQLFSSAAREGKPVKRKRDVDRGIIKVIEETKGDYLAIRLPSEKRKKNESKEKEEIIQPTVL